jgi:hypothetical protein
VVSLNPARLALAEYRRFEGFKAEIQIRTVIQHAWAEIEHDLGYKRELAIPKTVRRKFFQLAAMLEMADEGFTSIKQTLTQYEKEVGEAISTTPETVEIDATSIREYINTSLVLKSCEEKICTRLNCSIEDFTENVPERDAASLRWVGLRTVNELDEFLKANSEVVVAMAVNSIEGYIGKRNIGNETLIRGISLLYVCYVILGRKGNLEEFMKYYNENGFGPDNDTLKDIAHKHIAFVSQFDNSSPRK